MADRCPLCHRPSISDLAYWQRSEPVPVGACELQGGAECDAAAEVRTALAWRVVEAARRLPLAIDGRCPGCREDVRNPHSPACPWVLLRDALRALDGEEGR